MSPDMATGELPGTLYGFSDNGWTNSLVVREAISEVYTCNKAYTFAGRRAYM